MKNITYTVGDNENTAVDIGGQKKAGQTHEHHWKKILSFPGYFYIRDLSLRVRSVYRARLFVSSSYSSHTCNKRCVDSLELDYQRHIFTRKEKIEANNSKRERNIRSIDMSA